MPTNKSIVIDANILIRAVLGRKVRDTIQTKVSTKTVNRAQKQHLPLKDTDVCARLAKLQEIASLGLMVYSRDGLREFLTTPLQVFNGYTAIDLMSIGEYDRVIGALAADFEGLGY